MPYLSLFALRTNTTDRHQLSTSANPNITAVHLDGTGRQSVVVGSDVVDIWPKLHRKSALSDKTHEFPIVGVLLNKLFKVIVTGDISGVVRVWDMESLAITTHFDTRMRITAMAFDNSTRRLLIGQEDGGVTAWNYRYA